MENNTMKTGRLIFRNLKFYWRTHLAMVLGVAVAVAVLTGALLVGQSVRDSLRQLVYQRIGSADFILTSDNFFGERLSNYFPGGFASCPIFYIRGALVRERTQVRANNINIYGVDERFWKFNQMTPPGDLDDRAAFLGEELAKQLEAKEGDALLLRVETQQAIPKEWLYGRRDTSGRTIRLDCRRIIPSDKLGEFALRPSQGKAFTIFVPLRRLQKDLSQPANVNAVLFARNSGDNSHKAKEPIEGVAEIRRALKQGFTLPDLGIRLRNLPSGNGFSLESNRIVLNDTLAQAATEAAVSNGMHVAPIYTYLANSIRADGQEIPYSVITAANPGPLTFNASANSTPEMKPPGERATIWLTGWAAQNLKAQPGASVEVDYYLWADSGQLLTKSARFSLGGTVLPSESINASFAPEIPGITEARSISAWDPPFPLDLSRIRSEDEDFWNKYKATPKAFISLQEGERLWGSRFGKITAIRISLPGSTAPEAAREHFSASLLQKMDPQQMGFQIIDLRQQGLAASRGSTNFGEYFVYFSSFLIAAAMILSALFFKLMIEQRVRELGILRATGFSISMLRRIFLFEGLFLSLSGSLLGIMGSLAYGWFMVFGLRTFWNDAVGTRQLSFHLSWTDLLIGITAGIAFSILAVLITLRHLGHNSPRMLLYGILEDAGARQLKARILLASAVAASIASFLCLLGSSLKLFPPLEGFFGSGFCLLIAILCWTTLYLRRKNLNPLRGNGWPSLIRFGIRNAAHRPGRSAVCAVLIASATFIIISMEAFRQDPHAIGLAHNSGTGGFPLIAESSIPMIQDPNTEEGREVMGLAAIQAESLRQVRFVPFRERPGDDASCLNLYAPQEMKILGAPHDFIASGRFSFQDSLAATPAERKNPWLLLEPAQNESIIPAVADANTIQYILHLSLGSEISVRGNNGKPLRIRLVAALKDSVLQGQLVISEAAFLKAFPEYQGYRFFLVDMPPEKASELKMPLQEALADWGLEIESTRERLTAFHRVENTYISTFQSLGALGLVLGTAGLATILLRNVLERRKELALLRAAGYSKRAISGIIICEHIVLLAWGLAAGAICALVAIIPALQSRGAAIPFSMAGLLILAVTAAGLISSLVAVVAALRSPLISALHSE